MMMRRSLRYVQAVLYAFDDKLNLKSNALLMGVALHRLSLEKAFRCRR